MENSAHSYTEGAEYRPEDHTAEAEKFKVAQLPADHITVTMALSKFVELHEREAAGDETITMKEWKAAITDGRKALEQATN